MLMASSLAALLAAGTGCSDDGPGDASDVTLDTGGADTTLPDTVLADTSPPPDTTGPDTGLPPTDTGGPPTDTGDTTVTDTEPPPACGDTDKEFECPCEFNQQCASGYCVPVDEADVANRCSRTCLDGCPDGWNCKGAGNVGDPVFICVPEVNNLCKQCFVDADCNAVGDKCLAFEDGMYCGRDCQEGADACPDTYSCQEITDDLGQITAYQCVPESGSCNCPPGTDYANDPFNCGTCGNVCEFAGGVAGCSAQQCVLNGCQAGFINLDNNDTNGCEYACTVTSQDDWPDASCDGSSCDQDCDGIDGSWARGVFVSPGGSPNGAGTPNDPISTVTGGIAKAMATVGKDHVYVAAGSYSEQVRLEEAVSVFGGYSNDGLWQRDLSSYETVLTGGAGTTSVRTVIADGIAARTVLDGVTVRAENNTNPSGSSYAIWVRSSTSDLELVRVKAVGGNGGPGQSGIDGADGPDAVVGSPGKTTTDSDANCNEEDTYGGAGGAGAPSTCPSGGGGGGKGGDSGCGDEDPKPDSGNPSPGGASGGPAPSGEGTNGNTGTAGGNGNSGSNGSGGSAGGTVNASGFWRGADGDDGSDGQDGVGGGGGSGGAGDDGGTFGFSKWGGGGGGGGGGGCRGLKGTSGRAGGGSFGVFLFDASPKIRDSSLGHKSGGNGGSGGEAGQGGQGKGGGSGGGGHSDAGSGGKGGAGGSGGDGGHGGGGAGGIAYGLYIGGASDPVCNGLDFSPAGSGGGGGIGGIGGTAAGNKGADGVAGDKNKASGSCP